MARSLAAHIAVRQWISRLDDPTYVLVQVALSLLNAYGPGLGKPLVDDTAGSRVHNLYELHPCSHEHQRVRILFAFDPAGNVILLVAGDDRGDHWYRETIQTAERRYIEHLEDLRKDRP